MDSSSKLIKTPVAAEILGLSAAKLERFRCDGGGPAYVKLGRMVRYRSADLQDWVERNLTHNQSDKSQEAKASLSS